VLLLVLNNPIIIKHSYDRPNLYIEISQKSDSTFDTKIIPLLEKYKNDKILIYCKTKQDTETLSDKINNKGYTCHTYHAGKGTKDRNNIQNLYTNENINIIVATIAFGMGINISNIRVLIHYNCPNDLESYIQEIGRAGRDGKNSYCYMFYSNKDFFMNNFFLKDIKDSEHKKYKEKELSYLKEFVYSNECRRKILLNHFGETIDKCNNCDNCIKFKKIQKDYTNEAILIFSIMSDLNRYGLNTIVKMLLGSKEKKIKVLSVKFPKYYGQGKSYTEVSWKKIFTLLIKDKYIIEEQVNQDINVIVMSNKAISWYQKYKENGQKIIDKIMLNTSEEIVQVVDELEQSVQNFKHAFPNKPQISDNNKKVEMETPIINGKHKKSKIQITNEQVEVETIKHKKNKTPIIDDNEKVEVETIKHKKNKTPIIDDNEKVEVETIKHKKNKMPIIDDNKKVEVETIKHKKNKAQNSDDNEHVEIIKRKKNKIQHIDTNEKVEKK